MRKMKDSGVEWIGEIPEGWTIERLQWHVSEIKESNKPEKTRQVLSLTNKRGVIPYEEKGAQGNVAKEDYSQYKLAYPGTIVANSMNILIGSVGRCDYFGCVSPVYYVYKPNEGENLAFIDYIFQMEQFQKELRRYANGILEIRLRVPSDGILKREIAFPTKEAQEKIVHCLNQKCTQIDTLIQNVQTQIEKLKAYKQSLITEVVTKGLDPTVPMKDSGVDWIGEIPEHWSKLPVKYIGTTQNGISKGGEYFGSGHPFVSYGDVYKNMELPRSVAGLVESTEAERENYSVKTGDIFFTRTSETIDEVGFSSVCTETIQNATFAGFLIRLRPFNDVLTSLYAKYYFRGNHIRRYLVKEMNLVTRASLGQGLLKAMPVLLPPPDEQIVIAEYLRLKCSQIDRLISIKQEKIEKLEQYKRSLIYEYVTGKKEVV
ncbi:MAG: restriction endonuclease subunit S [Akkermansia sp.]|nr:restriction endonuclease subunit S [Akkermansia sp.]